MNAKPRALIHVQHLLGIGHLRRALALGRALAGAGAEVTVASGGMRVPNLPADGLNLVQLPPARAVDATFKQLLDEHGRPVDDAWRARRKEALLALFASTSPDLLAIELYPFGRRQLRFELEPLLDAAHARTPRPAIACSLRDIIHPPAPGRVEGVVAAVRERFDMVLVHGDPGLIPLDLSFPEASRIAQRLRYTGYLLDQPLPRVATARREPEVIVSSGGGAVGEPLLKAALAARGLTRYRDRPWRLLAGHNLEENAFQALCREAPRGVTVERARPDFTALLPDVLCSVSQAGYNTVIEVLTARAPAVFVPFADEAEVEQTLRCRALQRHGLCRWVAPAGLEPLGLARVIDAAEPPPPGLKIDTDGGRKSAQLLLRAVAEKATFARDLSQRRDP
ncbi:MAG: glycosyltransferase family protein [Rhodospirillales bacterium]